MLLMSNKILWQSVFHVHSPLKFNATEIPWHGNQFCAHWAATAEWGRASISTSLHNMAFQIASLKMEMCAKAHHTSLNAGKLLETSTKPALRMTSFRSSNEMLHIWMLLVNLFFLLHLLIQWCRFLTPQTLDALTLIACNIKIFVPNHVIPKMKV